MHIVVKFRFVQFINFAENWMSDNELQWEIVSNATLILMDAQSRHLTIKFTLKCSIAMLNWSNRRFAQNASCRICCVCIIFTHANSKLLMRNDFFCSLLSKKYSSLDFNHRNDIINGWFTHIEVRKMMSIKWIFYIYIWTYVCKKEKKNSEMPHKSFDYLFHLLAA